MVVGGMVSHQNKWRNNYGGGCITVIAAILAHALLALILVNFGKATLSWSWQLLL